MLNSATGKGGGIYNTTDNAFGRGAAYLTLVNSTVSGNSAAFGGGIENSDRLGGASFRATNSTIALNTATREGGGIRHTPGEEQGNYTRLTNTLVADNTAPIGPDLVTDEFGATVTFSLIGDGTGSYVTNAGGNKVGNVTPYGAPIDPMIEPLALNGGPTRTHALEGGSPAIDTASPLDCPATDQRGVARPQGEGCDIGSYERE